MADFDASEDLHFLLQTKLETSSTSKFLRLNFVPRFFGIALFVVVCLLFPSEPPEFISHTVFAKCWEIVHLLIIGIFVSYGLFGRRRAQNQMMRNHASPALRTHNIARASAIFNFEHQNPCYDNIGRSQAWEFAPLGLEPTVVVRPGDCDFDYEPLDLPVRRLRSKVESDSEDFANDSEFEADRTGCCYSEEDNESEDLEGNASPVPWNWSNPAEELRFGVDYEAEQQPLLSDQSSASPEPPTLGGQNSWVKPEQPPLATPKPNSMVASPPKEEAEALQPPSSSKGSSPLSSSSSEEPPPVESRTVSVDAFSYVGTQEPELRHSKSYRKPVENLTGNQTETMFSPSPASLKSKSMRMHFKEEATGVSSFLGNEDFKLHHPKSFRSPMEVRDAGEDVEAKFFPPYASSSSVGTQDPRLRRSKSSRPPKLESPMSNPMPPSLSGESSPLCSAVPESPTIEVENKQKESKKLESSEKESSENQMPSPLIQNSSSISKRGGSRSRRCRKREDFSMDMQGSEKWRKDSLRNEYSSDQPVSSHLTSLSALSHDFASAVEPKSSRYTDGFSPDDENMHGSPAPLTVKQNINDNVVSKEACKTEIQELESDNIPCKATSPLNPSRNDAVVSMESNSDSANKADQLPTPLEDGRKTLSRTSHSRRFSCSAFFDRELWKGSKDETKEGTKKGKDDDAASNSGKCGWDCLKLDVKPNLTKGALTGKSVRTVKPRAITSEPNHASGSSSDKQKSSQNVAEKTRERQDVVIISIGISAKNGRQPNDTSQKGKKHEGVGRASLQLDKDKERSHGKMSVLENVNEDEDYTSEIDRKADEFIAKFKQQIRLQKLASTSNRHQTLC